MVAEAAGEAVTRERSEDVVERVLERWQRLRPDAAGPDLFRALAIEDAAAKRTAVVALLDGHPDDAVVVWHATNELRQAGEAERVTAVLETFVARNAERPVGYRMLAQNARSNQTRLAEVLERWARATPGDPELVSAWLGSTLPRQEPDRTQRVVAELFARRPGGQADLGACLEVLRGGDPEFAAAARACVARTAADPAAPPHVVEQATTEMAGMAAADGDWSALVGSLDDLEPEVRFRSLLTAARRVEAPARCTERVDLLTLAASAVGEVDDGLRSVASALDDCSGRPEARDLFLELLGRAATEEVPGVVHAWLTRVNRVLQGELPAGSTALLEQRLRAEPDAAPLLEALALAYELADPEGRRLEVLRRWQQVAPGSFRGEKARDLAWELVERERPEEAVEVLERQLETGFEREVGEALWELYVETEGPERAASFAADLLRDEQPWKVGVGHHLAARSALLGGDLAGAEAHYWQALASHGHDDLALELLGAVAARGEAAGLAATARRICEVMRQLPEGGELARCTAELLTRAGSGSEAARVLATQAADLPDDLEALGSLAATAQAAGEAEVAERALRRMLELDPRTEHHWSGLGGFLERQGRVEELVDLLRRAGERFSPPPVDLARATGRALAAAGRPRQAIDVLREARGALPDPGGEWSRSWIDHELREAYTALGREVGFQGRRAPVPRASLPAAEAAPALPDGTAEELRRVAEALQSGAGGRYEPATAGRLYVRAAALGDPLAAYRLAILRALRLADTAEGEPTAEELYQRSATAVEELAQRGDAFAQYLVGTALDIGLGAPEDPVAARLWLERAAAQGESWAWHNLGSMAERGRGLAAPDPAAAVASYRRASEAGNARSMLAFASLTLTREGSGAPCEEGLRWLERSARLGNAAAAAFLGKLLFYGRGACVARAPQAALPWLEAGAATDQPGAGYDLGLALLVTGEAGEARARGLSLLETVAARPDRLAVETLAYLHAAGIGVARDAARARRMMAEAARLGSDGFPDLRRQSSPFFAELFADGAARLEALAREGDAAAAAFLAHLYSVGLGPEVEPQRVVTLASRAAARGEGSAMRLLSGLYLRGEGVEADEAEGRRWQRRGAEAGDSFCMMFLGNDLIEGRGVERDVEAGLRWLVRAAETGNWFAVNDLGHLYDEGWQGIPRDPEAAAAWKRRVADLGDPEATGWLAYHGGR
jgi:TPR repeat protein/predicted Zn-dependent protease